VVALCAIVGPVAAWGARKRAVTGRERVEYRLEHFDDLLLAPDHQAISALEAPDASRRSDVDIMNPVLTALAEAPDIVLEESVSAVDYHVTGLGDGAERRDRIFG